MANKISRFNLRVLDFKFVKWACLCRINLYANDSEQRQSKNDDRGSNDLSKPKNDQVTTQGVVCKQK